MCRIDVNFPTNSMYDIMFPYFWLVCVYYLLPQTQNPIYLNRNNKDTENSMGCMIYDYIKVWVKKLPENFD